MENATPENAQSFSLDRFEKLCYQHQHEDASKDLLRLLTMLEIHYGRLGELGGKVSGSSWAEEMRERHVATRLAAAIGALVLDKGFNLSLSGFNELIQRHRWFDNLFGASSFVNADYLLNQWNEADDPQQGFRVNEKNLLKFLLFYSGDSAISLQAERLWQANPQIAASLFFALLSSRVVISDNAFRKKELLLEWLPQQLDQLEDLENIPSGYLHDVWMHCSYAMTPKKHDIKRSINRLMRNSLVKAGFKDRNLEQPYKPVDGKPVVMVILEWFLSSHSIYRTHSTAARALKEKYHLIGVSLNGKIDEKSSEVFDSVFVIPQEPDIKMAVERVMALADQFNPELVYYPSVGMFPQTVLLINLRLAEIQMAALGHPATTHSNCIDYILVEEDYLGNAECFSEKVMALPADSLPYVPPKDDFSKIPSEIRKQPDVIKIAVAATAMKLNPVFLRACQAIAQRSEQDLEFHFLTGYAIGISKVHIQNLIHAFLPEAVVYPHTERAQYVVNLNRCDLFINPFPFGNTNGLVDTVRQGLPGICLTGDEVLSHIDEGLFNRLGLEEWMIAHTVEEYINAAVKLANDHKLRVKLSRDLEKRDPDQILFQGNAEHFLQSVEYLHKNHVSLQESPEQLIRLPE